MFIEFTIKDAVDIVLVALLLYYFYKLMKESGSLNVFLGILVFLFSWVFVSKMLKMRLLGSIFDQLMSVGTLALVVIFHDEIRSFFRNIGSHRRLGIFSKFFSRNKQAADSALAMPVVMACMSMAQQKTGALIVIEGADTLEEIIKTGESLNASVNQRLLESIFFKNAPLHDGAVVIRGNKIVAAQCILPVSRNLSIPKELGLRHRSAMGISENTDAIAIVVSEETGSITAAVNGKFSVNLDARQLEEILAK